jgi:hypothetical protein
VLMGEGNGLLLHASSLSGWMLESVVRRTAVPFRECQ